MASTDNTTGQQAETAANYVFLSGDAQPLNAENGDRRFWVVHPSRSTPLCRDCSHMHLLGGGFMRFEMCDHPSAPRCPVTGSPDLRCGTNRNEGRPCGPTGALFTPVNSLA